MESKTTPTFQFQYVPYSVNCGYSVVDWKWYQLHKFAHVHPNSKVSDLKNWLPVVNHPWPAASEETLHRYLLKVRASGYSVPQPLPTTPKKIFRSESTIKRRTRQIREILDSVGDYNIAYDILVKSFEYLRRKAANDFPNIARINENKLKAIDNVIDIMSKIKHSLTQ